MDRKLIKQYGEDILSYRLRTARQKKRMQYEDFDKQLLSLNREQRALSKLEDDLGWEPLDPPVQRGWNRCFVLRDDVARSNKAVLFANILDKINTNEWSYRKDFLVRKRRYGKNKYEVKLQGLKVLSEDDFKKIDLTESEKCYFDAVFYFTHWSNKLRLRYAFTEPWRFVLKVRPNMIDKIKKEDVTIESRQREIRNYMSGNHYDKRLIKLRYGADKWRFKVAYNRASAELKNKPLSQILDSIND